MTHNGQHSNYNTPCSSPCSYFLCQAHNMLGVTYEVVWTQTGCITCQTTEWSFNTGSVIEWFLSCVSCTNTLELTLLLSQVWQEALSPCAISMLMSLTMSKFHKHTPHTIFVCTKWYAPFFSHTYLQPM